MNTKENAKEVIDHIIQWMDAYLTASGLRGFAIGVSGGIDSAVTSALCAGTGKKVLALNMPIYQARDQVSRAKSHIDWLTDNFDNVTGKDVELSPIFDRIKQSFPPEIQDDLTMANTRSRLRMLTLYTFASNQKLLVAGTGNKVEDFGVGFYTKYGDGGVDLSPIADLMKSEVYALGREMGIMEEILTAPPTDGLWEDDRTDESQIGATYEELEWAMTYLASDKSQAPDKRQKEVLSIYNTLHTANRHKMDAVPVCLIPESLRNQGK